MYKKLFKKTQQLLAFNKAIVVLFLALCVQASFAQQDKKVVINADNPTVHEVFKSLEGQTGYRIAYDENLSISRRIKLPRTPMSLTEMITLVLNGTGRDFIIHGDVVIIQKARETSSNADTQSPATTPNQTEQKPPQKSTIKGKIVDYNDNTPIAGVAIRLVTAEGDSYADISDTSGNFAIVDTPIGACTIGATKQGYISTELQHSITANSDNDIVIMMTPQQRNNTVVDGRIVVEDDRPRDFALTAEDLILPNTPKRTLPLITLKTNLLHDLTGNINLGTEFRTGKKTSVEISASYNNWNFKDNKKYKNLTFMPEFRLWTCEAFRGHFFGAHAFYSRLNIGGVKIPFGLFPGLEKYRYQGDLIGGGITYGYQFSLTPRLNMEMSIGVGYAQYTYDQFECRECGKLIDQSQKTFVGPTKAGISLIYIIK